MLKLFFFLLLFDLHRLLQTGPARLHANPSARDVEHVLRPATQTKNT